MGGGPIQGRVCLRRATGRRVHHQQMGAGLHGELVGSLSRRAGHSGNTGVGIGCTVGGGGVMGNVQRLLQRGLRIIFYIVLHVLYSLYIQTLQMSFGKPAC